MGDIDGRPGLGASDRSPNTFGSSFLRPAINTTIILFILTGRGLHSFVAPHASLARRRFFPDPNKTMTTENPA
jgi:hypothetical protein